MAVLGLDLGTTTLGIAKSDALGISHPIETFRFPPKAYSRAIARAVEFIQKYDIKEVALGLPLHLSGEESDMSKAVRIFKEKIEEQVPNISITLVDERYTTVISLRNLSSMGYNSKEAKKFVDMQAASEILETYLRQKNK